MLGLKTTNKMLKERREVVFFGLNVDFFPYKIKRKVMAFSLNSDLVLGVRPGELYFSLFFICHIV